MTVLDDGRPLEDERSVADESPSSPDVAVTAHRSRPDRSVFVEEDNSDAWIASDLTIDLTR